MFLFLFSGIFVVESICNGHNKVDVKMIGAQVPCELFVIRDWNEKFEPLEAIAYGNEKSNLLLCVHGSIGKFCWYLPIFELNSTSHPEELGHKKGRWQNFLICESYMLCMYHLGLAQKEIELWKGPNEEMKKDFKQSATIFQILDMTSNPTQIKSRLLAKRKQILKIESTKSELWSSRQNRKVTRFVINISLNFDLP